jgi:multidrug efflux pump subunit AcrA (membrane-fusion protein)
MKKRTKGIVIAVLIVAAVALMVGPKVLGGASGKPGAPASPGGGAQVSTVYSVRTQVLKVGSLRDYLDLTGEVVTETNVDIYADVGGRLSAVYVQVGDQVVKGKTLIATVDPSKPGSNYALSPVYSPLTGTVTAVNGQLGATVTTTTSLGTVGVLTDLYVDAKVPETQVASVKLGLKAEIVFEAFPGRVFQAVIQRVSPVVDTTSRTKTIRLRFLSDASSVSLGMFAKVKVYFENRPEKVLVPQEAVITRNNKPYAFVVADGKGVRREVSEGLLVDGTLEVESGLKAGEILVVKGQELLDDGSPVKVVGK